MSHSRVHLPPGDLIDTFLLTRQIARAVRPNLRHARGIDCVIGKLVALPDQPFGTRGEFTAAERQEMSKFLPLLPPLHGNMSAQERSAFWDEFDRLSERPSWRPQLPAIEEIQGSAYANAEIQERHLKALGDEIQSGRIIAIDRQHIQVLVVGLGISIQRSDAVKYLRSHGLSEAAEIGQTAPVIVPKSQRADRKTARVQQTTEYSKQPCETAVSDLPHSSELGDGVMAKVGQTIQPAQRDPREHRRLATIIEPATRPTNAPRPTVILRRRQVEERTALSRSAIYEKLDVKSPRYDPTFPKQIKMGVSSVGWIESEIEVWLEVRITSRAVSSAK